MSEKRSKRRFILGMVLYALIFIAIAAGGLYLLWQYMDAYEYSRPDSAMDRYMENLDEEHIKALSADFISTEIDPNLQSRQEAEAFILGYVGAGLEYAKVPTESVGGKEVYALMLGSEALGRVVLEQQGEGDFGFAQWQVTEEYLEFSAHLNSSEITVPTDCVINMNGFDLTEEYISERDVHYELLHELYDHGAEFPTMYKYTSGSYLGELPVELKLSDGSVYPYKGEYNEMIFTDNCTEETIKGLSRFYKDFLGGYVYFTSGAQGVNIYNYYAVIGYVEYNSDLYHRIGQAVQGMGFANSRGDTLKSINIDRAMDLGNGYQVCQITYLVETTGFDGVVTTTNTQKVLTHYYPDAGGYYRAVAMASIEGGLYE